MHENLGRDAVFLDEQALDTGLSWPAALESALLRSRVLLAVFSRQYFKKSWCKAEIDSMIQRQVKLGLGTTNNPQILVHAIVAHDCEEEDRIPEPYRNIQRRVFKNFVYDFTDTDWAFYRDFQDAVNGLAERLADTVERVPEWHPEFPIVRPQALLPDKPAVPRF